MGDLPGHVINRIHLFAFSRGGIMALWIAILRNDITSLVTWAGVSDIFLTYDERTDMRRMMKRVIGGTPTKNVEAYENRNALAAGVTGKRDDKWGQVPIAFVVLKENVTEDELKDFMKTQIASYKQPVDYGGEPRKEAVEIIREAEKMNRGYYAAPIGWINTDGDGEFAVGIRSALIENDQAYLFAGGGIVAESSSIEEFEETRVKFRPMLRTLGGNMNE